MPAHVILPRDHACFVSTIQIESNVTNASLPAYPPRHASQRRIIQLHRKVVSSIFQRLYTV